MTNQQILTHSFAANPSAPRDVARLATALARTADGAKTMVRTAHSWIQFWTTAL